MILVATLLGAFIGWLASLYLKEQSNEAILIDIGVGTLGSIVLSLLLATSTLLDTSLSAFLGAMFALLVLYGVRCLRSGAAG